MYLLHPPHEGRVGARDPDSTLVVVAPSREIESSGASSKDPIVRSERGPAVLSRVVEHGALAARWRVRVGRSESPPRPRRRAAARLSPARSRSAQNARDLKAMLLTTKVVIGSDSDYM